MYATKEMSLHDFLTRLNINCDKLNGDFQVQDLKFYKKSRKLILGLKSHEIINSEELDHILREVEEALKIPNPIKIEYKYTGNPQTAQEFIAQDWNNIIYFLKNMIPSIKGTLNETSYILKDGDLRITVSDSFTLKKAKERNVHIQIEDHLKNWFGLNIKCVLELDEKSAFHVDDYESQKEKESMQFVQEINKASQNSEMVTSNKGKRVTVVDDDSILIGRKFSGEIIKLTDLKNELGTVIVEGEVFNLECRELKGGKKLLSLQITDYSNSITVKIFERKKQVKDLEELFHKGQYIRVKGDMTFDKFMRENVLMASDVVNMPQEKGRWDNAPEKRIEFHMHTKMSSMDGVSSTSELVKRAADWGHEAIAITDHGVVQAFPEAMDAGKKHGIKVIYGMEGYLINDEAKIIPNATLYSLDDEYIVFDIETTGLSNRNDRITEIGAVKIKDSQVIDKFSALVNPEMKIPSKIVELTGITDDMVVDKQTIDVILPGFLAFIGSSPVVAHNSDFDMGFIRENANRIERTIENQVIDTLKLSRILLPQLKRHRLNSIAKELNVSLENHHRAVDDAQATAEIFVKFIELLKQKEVYTLEEVNTKLVKDVDYKKLDTYHIMIYAKNQKGLKNLYQIISESHLEYFYKKPRVPKSILTKYREGLLIGTACEAGELYKSILGNKPESDIEKTASYYDYLEIQPISNNQFLLEKGMVNTTEELQNINKKIVALGNKINLPVIATGDVHFLDPNDEVFRKILMAGQGFTDADNQAPLYLKTTDEMLDEFRYLGSKTAKDVVVNNPRKLNEEIEKLIPIPDGTFPPEIEGSDEELRRMCYEKAERIYGNPIPEIVKTRLDKELNSIISNGYAVMYIIAQKLVTKSLRDGYLVGSRGSVGSSFAATMSDITEVNPLAPHYVCPECRYSEFITDGSYGSGADLPDKKCPECHGQLIKDGHEIPFEVFLGFEGDKEPDIDLNFAGEYQSEAHHYTEELFGKGKVYRAGTIGTIADKTAYGFVKKYLEERELYYTSAEVNRLTMGCTGVKRTSGQHPGGVMIVPANLDVHEFSPIQYPANDSTSGVITMHFDYHSISGRLLKLDILGHDVPTIIKMLEDLTGINAQEIPLDDEKTISLFTTTKNLGIDPKELGCEVGTLGIPEFGTKFVRQMLLDTKPSTFGELVRISGLSHGTDVWLNNAQDLVRNNIAELKDVISTRDDIMNYLMLKGLPPKSAFKIMENVRKGKGLKPEEEQLMKENNVPEWYIDSCKKIKYMFPKAHAAAYVMMSFRIAYCKVHYPQAFYATYFTTKAEDFDAHLIGKGKAVVKSKIDELELMGNDLTAKDKNFLTVLEVALELYCRNIELLSVDVYKSDPDKFTIIDGKLLPPLRALQGVGQNAARNIAKVREAGEFLSKEDLRERAKVTKTVIEALTNHGCIADLPDTNQLSLF
ncbi:DNA polymerase III, alpha subunit [Alkaliphilus metalliredigens QYMF]|uniref:DNA polymerase III PolC-type n=1 Tax=Alkaliphilus metalliredigens (strain QYMF) TaxID=293826 RepID=A6TRL2_ALKMQ|nr:PolC-type DNA polymerase III [Alkaliphilus metalliredigens]ABR48830.1 DNA polymerase III, alpha subunit [Alkaliphilus metalliredigens QYMF]